jgi:formylglycine-generating enzyme required for sulfatase activity
LSVLTGSRTKTSLLSVSPFNMVPENIQPRFLLFLSHAGADTGSARTLKKRIEASPVAIEAGLKVWFDKDDLQAGRDWQTQLEETIEKRATAFAVYVGSRGLVNWVEQEVRLALSRAAASNGQFSFIPILAAQVETSTALPGFVRQFQGVWDVENRPDEFQKLLAAVLGKAGAGNLQLESEPFFGLKAIDETRNHLFFGREQDTQTLVDRLRKRPLLIVTGDSGSGKSSLVRAGLIPRWRGGALAEEEGRRLNEEIWHVVEMRPTANPLRALGDAVFSASLHLGRTAADRGTYKEWAMGADAEKRRDGLRCGLPANATHTLLIVDQFEELFTLTPPEQRKSFVILLLDLIDPPDGRFVVVLTMRRDYYNLCSEFPELYIMLESNDRAARYLLERMKTEDLRRVITEPLKLAGVEEGDRAVLAQSVLQDVGDRAGDLALVQFALTEAWRRRREYGNDLLRAYTAVGRVEGALARAAERVYVEELGGDGNERVIQAVFIRLVRLGDTGGATRRMARRSEFDERRWNLLQTLASEKGNRLVLISGGEKEETAEIAHEAFVTQWPRFQTWLQNKATEKRTLDALIERAARWSTVAIEHDRSGWLAAGLEREAFAQLVAKHPEWLSATERTFVEASVQAEDKRVQRELEMHQSQLLQAQRLAEEASKREEAERARAAVAEKARRRQWYLNLALLILLLGVGMTAWLLKEGVTVQYAGSIVLARLHLVQVPDTEMIKISGGHYQPGSRLDESEEPVRDVTIKPFALGKYEVAFEEYDQYVELSGSKPPVDEGWGRGHRPVIIVSWDDAKVYAKWLSQATGKRYRLPTEAEWEYAARSGGKDEKWAGTSEPEQLSKYAVYSENSGLRTAPVGSKYPNSLGLHDMSGNVWEWVEDCWHANYKGATTDGSAWLEAGGTTAW